MYRRTILATALFLVASAAAFADEGEVSPNANAFTDYGQAVERANLEHKMLVIFFHETGENRARDAFEAKSLADEQVRAKLADSVLLKVPVDYKIAIQGKMTSLLGHAAFAEMQGRQGIAIVDYANADAEYFGYVVSTFPFSPGLYLTPAALRTIVDLPKGTLTQRTMVYAVRMHPEAPASTTGDLLPVLATEAASHSKYQADIRVQGHHFWERRFHRINGRIPSGYVAQEVCAESWPNQDLVEAALECVSSWRQSSGHWSAVRARQRYYGYDIKRGGNGIWYATGIFGNRG